jgi:hypothetical protein
MGNQFYLQQALPEGCLYLQAVVGHHLRAEAVKKTHRIIKYFT